MTQIYRVTVEIYSDFFPGRKILRAVPQLFVRADSLDEADITAQSHLHHSPEFGGSDFAFTQIDRLDFSGPVGKFITVWKKGR